MISKELAAQCLCIWMDTRFSLKRASTSFYRNALAFARTWIVRQSKDDAKHPINFCSVDPHLSLHTSKCLHLFGLQVGWLPYFPCNHPVLSVPGAVTQPSHANL
jgi:hypothetical protein